MLIKMPFSERKTMITDKFSERHFAFKPITKGKSFELTPNITYTAPVNCFGKFWIIIFIIVFLCTLNDHKQQWLKLTNPSLS